MTTIAKILRSIPQINFYTRPLSLYVRVTWRMLCFARVVRILRIFINVGIIPRLEYPHRSALFSRRVTRCRPVGLLLRQNLIMWYLWWRVRIRRVHRLLLVRKGIAMHGYRLIGRDRKVCSSILPSEKKRSDGNS